MVRINVMTFKSGILDSNELYQSFFEDNDKEVTERAENRFKELAREINSEVTSEELDIALEDGGYDNLNGREVIISWPEIK